MSELYHLKKQTRIYALFSEKRQEAFIKARAFIRINRVIYMNVCMV